MTDGPPDSLSILCPTCGLSYRADVPPRQFGQLMKFPCAHCGSVLEVVDKRPVHGVRRWKWMLPRGQA